MPSRPEVLLLAGGTPRKEHGPSDSRREKAGLRFIRRIFREFPTPKYCLLQPACRRPLLCTFITWEDSNSPVVRILISTSEGHFKRQWGRKSHRALVSGELS